MRNFLEHDSERIEGRKLPVDRASFNACPLPTAFNQALAAAEYSLVLVTPVMHSN
ncbi:hypothetical protein G6L20_32340 [Agrobacterium rhizogenes]|nr:hypothetical protein [Rhizobium rhizogenes]